MLSGSKIFFGGIFLAAISLGLAGCNLPLNAQVSTPNATEVYFTAVAIITEKADASSESPTQPATTPVPQVITPTVGLTPLDIVTVALLAPSATPLCDLAKPGVPLDVTIPDDTRMQPGESFTKIWRFENEGFCPWTKDYAVVWFSGDDLGLEKVQSFSDPVQPGESVEVNVEMVAPMDPGVYSSYWMMRSGQGVLFGLGPNGDAPFWVRIQVVAVSTTTPTPTLTPTATPVVHITGSASLQPGQTFDLDNGKVSQGEGGDLSLNLSDKNEYKLTPLNNSRLGVFGPLQPAEVDCRGAVLSTDPVEISKVSPGDYLCYRTNQGLPGSLHLVQLPQQGTALQFDYLTWAAP